MDMQAKNIINNSFKENSFFIVGYFNRRSFYIAKLSNKKCLQIDTTVFIEYYIVLKEHQLHYDDALQVSNTFDIKFKPVLHDVTD